MPYIASKTSIRFTLIISLKKISQPISLSKVMNLLDSLLTNSETSTSAITTTCELLISIFCNKSLLDFKDQVEINTIKEVLLHTLCKLDSNIEVVISSSLLIIN